MAKIIFEHFVHKQRYNRTFCSEFGSIPGIYLVVDLLYNTIFSTKYLTGKRQNLRWGKFHTQAGLRA
jgi:hypothetical protein